MCFSPTNTSRAYTCWSIIINNERFQHASTVTCMPNTCTESGSYPLKYKLHTYCKNHDPLLPICCSIKRKTPTGYEKNWHSPLKKHSFSCFINNSKSLHKSVPRTTYLNYFPSSVFQNNRIYLICTSIVSKLCMQFASSRSRNLFLQILAQVILRTIQLYNNVSDYTQSCTRYWNKATKLHK